MNNPFKTPLSKEVRTINDNDKESSKFEEKEQIISKLMKTPTISNKDEKSMIESKEDKISIEENPKLVKSQIELKPEEFKPIFNPTQITIEDSNKGSLISVRPFLKMASKMQDKNSNLKLSLFSKKRKESPDFKKQLEKVRIESLINQVSSEKLLFQRLKESCRQANKKYSDSDFPPEKTSLSKDWSSLEANTQEKWKNFVWLRPEEIFKNEYRIFFDEIEPNDIKQGQLGDCYMLSALSSLAERPHLVKKIFHEHEVNEYGIYGLWFNVDGDWKLILIDDFFPCNSRSKTPAFSKGNGNELWVLLIEKAYAKMYGSYEIIEGGNPAIALRELTGAPYENKDEGNEEEMWEYLKTTNDKGYK